MPDVITFPDRTIKSIPMAHYEEIAVYGSVGPITVSLTRRTDAMAGLIHVVVLGSTIGLEVVATLPDDAQGRAVADFTGPAVLRAAELAETEFAARPEAC